MKTKTALRLMPYPVNLDNIVRYNDQMNFIKIYNKSRGVKELFSFDFTTVYDVKNGQNIKGQHVDGALNNMTYGELATLLDNHYKLQPIK